jgi:putative zinc finger protein
MGYETETPPADCRGVEPLLSSCAAGALDEDSERRVREHLFACAACRAAQLERDPSVLFLELHRAPLPPGFLDRVASDVRRRVEAGERPRWAPFAGGIPAFSARRLAYVAAPVMTLLLLGTLFLVRPGGPGFRGLRKPGEGGVSSPYVVSPGSARFGKPGVQGPGALPPLPGPPLMEEVGSPSARVYRFTVDGGGDETPIYFVVDESIDI